MHTFPFNYNASIYVLLLFPFRKKQKTHKIPGSESIFFPPCIINHSYEQAEFPCTVCCKAYRLSLKIEGAFTESNSRNVKSLAEA